MKLVKISVSLLVIFMSFKAADCPLLESVFLCLTGIVVVFRKFRK